MKAIAAIPLIFILAALSVGSAAVVSTLYSFPKEPATDSTDPIEIIGTGVTNAPWDDLVDLFFGGLFGVLIWLVTYFVIPGMNAAAAYATGKSIHFDPVWGYMVLSFFLLLVIWRKKETIYGFITKYIILVAIVLAVVFVLGVSLRLMGLV